VKFGIAHLNDNFHDWERHLGGSFGSGPATPDYQIMQESFQITDLAEKLGFDSVWSPEHHYDPYCMAPDCLQLLSYYAGRHQKLGVASMVVVLPWHDPLRVAEELALLDIMMDGRDFTIGLGRGLARYEYERMRVPMDTSRERFREAFEVIKLALTQGQFSYDGKFFQIPETVIRPQPKSKDLIDRVYISSVTPPSIQTAAELGVGLMIIPQKPWDDHVSDLKYYNRVRGEGGMAPRNPVVGVFMYCAETEDEAEEGYSKWLAGFNYSATKHYEFDDPDHFQATAGYEQYGAQRADTIEQGPERPSHEQVSEERAKWHSDELSDQAKIETGSVVGTPEQCIEKLRRAQATTTPAQMFGFVRFGGMPMEKAKRSMELFAKEVLPEVHKMPVLDPGL